jgi:small subunit ribosomal protein S6
LRDYELVVVLSPTLGEEGFPVTIERISGVIQGNGGEIKNVDQWGRRRLAYPIKRHLEGYYAVTKFAAEPTAIRAVEANLDLAEDVLRHLVIKLDGIKMNIVKPRIPQPDAAAPEGGTPEAVSPDAGEAAEEEVIASDVAEPEANEPDAAPDDAEPEANEPDAAPDAAEPDED